MEQLESIAGMLDLMVRPAFCVIDGRIAAVNPGARCRLIETGTPIEDLLQTGREEYREFRNGCLYLTLDLNGHPTGASLSCHGAYRIFILEEDDHRPELNALALAARELREPLSGIMTATDRMFPAVSDDPSIRNQVARINKGLFQLLRVIGNMSDAARYLEPAEQLPEVRDITAVLGELFQKSTALTEQAGIRLTFQNLSKPVLTLADTEKLERAIYNILSNAIKFTPTGGTIEASLTQRGKLLYLTVQDSGPGVDPAIRSGIHSRYLRQPGIEDGRYGIGLGMVLIRAAAAAHGGSVLMEHPADSGTRITMTLEIRQNIAGALRSPLFRVDYAGERDHGLVELSDVLPATLYQIEHIN